MKLKAGDKITALKLPNIQGGTFDIKTLQGKKSIITFYRFAQCPFCNLRISEFAAKYSEFENSLTVVAIFDSPLDHLKRSIRKHDVPFEILADENFTYYKKYDVEQSIWKFFLGSILRFYKLIPATLKGFIPLSFKGSLTTVPVDILLNKDGTIGQVHYGQNTTDHLPFKDVLEFAKK